MNNTTTINYQPGGRDVVFKIEEIESSLILTEEAVRSKAVDMENTLEILAIGPDVVGYEVGDRVLLRSPRYIAIAIDDVEYGQISCGELLGKTLNNASTKLTKSMKARITEEQSQNLGVLGSNHGKHVK